jgi:hypothetical protein
MERQTRFDRYRSDPEADDPMCLEGLEELDPEDAEAVKKIL